MVRLINRTDISKYRQISQNCHDDVLNQQIDDAQFLDISDLLGEELYNDLLLNSTDTKYKALLNGGSYTYQSKTYNNPGLKLAHVFYAYARYFKFGSYTDTAFSIVEKINPEQSTPVGANPKQAVYKLNQQIGFKNWSLVRKFLDRNASTYPLWGSECVVSNRNFRINKIV